VAEELRDGDNQLLHCLDCGRQVVARRHGGGCMLCGSKAVVIEDP
jgi:Zn finger protein HypA/HybF involved in hydrogenase expression